MDNGWHTKIATPQLTPDMIGQIYALVAQMVLSTA
jgi:hypothetical protein